MKDVFGLRGRVSVKGLGNQVFSCVFCKRPFFFKHVFSEIKENNFFTIFHEMSDLANPDGYKTWFLAVFTRTLKNGIIDFSIFQRFRENPFFFKVLMVSGVAITDPFFFEVLTTCKSDQPEVWPWLPWRRRSPRGRLKARDPCPKGILGMV